MARECDRSECPASVAPLHAHCIGYSKHRMPRGHVVAGCQSRRNAVLHHPKKVRSAKSGCLSQPLCNTVHDRRLTPKIDSRASHRFSTRPHNAIFRQRAPAPASSPSPSPSTDSAGYSSRNCWMTFCATQTMISNLTSQRFLNSIKIKLQKTALRTACNAEPLSCASLQHESKFRAGTYG